VEKFDLLLAVLRDMQKADILRHFVLVGSWCQNFYRYLYGNPVEIPAARTLDADMLIPKRLPKNKQVSISQIMQKNNFAVEVDFPSGLYKFTHPDLKFEFLTTPGEKPGEDVYRFKQLGITAQELRYMAIPLDHKMTITYEDLTLNIPEPKAFTLHKLIVCRLRRNPEKAQKDSETARGMLIYFEEKEQHVHRLHELYNSFPKGWRKRVDDGLIKIGMSLPEIPDNG
jgi:hypothetical protein